MKFFLILIISLTAQAFVEQENKTMSLGVGVRGQDIVYSDGQDPNINAIPLISLKYNRLRIRGSSLKYNILIKDEEFKLGPRFYYGGHRYTTTSEISAKKQSLFGGIYARLKYFQINLQKDLENKSKGYLVNIQTRIRWKDFYLIPRIQWMDKEYTSYYYLTPKASFSDSYSYSLSLIYEKEVINSHWEIFNLLSYEKFSNKISKSKIIKDSSFFQIIIGLTYKIDLGN